MTKDGWMKDSDRRAMMGSMMQEFFGGMSTDDKKEMCGTIMLKMTEGLDMKEMMPKMMMGMMSGGGGGGSSEMQDKMANMMQFSHERQIAQMPEMMLKMMMPHCIGMMLPAIDPDKRDEIAATILSAIVEKGTVGMSYEQIRAFHNTLDKVLKSST